MMMQIRDTFLIQYSTGRWGFVGSLPRSLGEEVKATTSDVMGGRAYRNEAGEIVTTRFPTFETNIDALNHAASVGVKVRV